MRINNVDEAHAQILADINHIQVEQFSEFEIDKLLFNQIYYALTRSDLFLFETITASLFFDREVIAYENNGSDLLFYSEVFNRKDHDGYWDKIRSTYDKKDIIQIDNLGKGKSLKCFKPLKFFRKINLFCSFNKKLSFIKGGLVRGYLSAQLVWFYEFYRKIKMLELNPKVAVCFCDTDFHESLLVQWFKNQNIVTITNQHGQPLLRDINIDRLNQSQILNFNSDYILVKGEFTKRQYLKAGIDEKRIIVVGDLVSPHFKYIDRKSLGRFAVFLDSPSYLFSNDTNRSLLLFAEEISNKMNLTYVVKLHPSDDEKRYANYNCKFVDKNTTLSDLFDMIDFGIFSASAIYIDMISHSVKPYQHCKVEFPIVENGNDIANDYNDFEIKYNNWLNMDSQEKKVYLETSYNTYFADMDASKEIYNFINMKCEEKLNENSSFSTN